MPPRKNQSTKERVPCKKCNDSMEGEHFAAKNCLKCRNPEAWIEANVSEPVVPMGDAIGPTPEEAKKLQEKVVPPPSLAPRVSSTPFFLKSGDDVSLNLKQRKFLVLPKSRWSLSPRKWFGAIPDPIDPVELKMLRLCLEAGDIVKGKVFTGVAKDTTTLTKAAKILEEAEITMKEALGKIVQAKGPVGGYLPYEIFRYLMRFEDDTEHRRTVLNFIQNALDHIGSGPLTSTPVVAKTIEQVTGMKF